MIVLNTKIYTSKFLEVLKFFKKHDCLLWCLRGEMKQCADGEIVCESSSCESSAPAKIAKSIGERMTTALKLLLLFDSGLGDTALNKNGSLNKKCEAHLPELEVHWKKSNLKGECPTIRELCFYIDWLRGLDTVKTYGVDLASKLVGKPRNQIVIALINEHEAKKNAMKIRFDQEIVELSQERDRQLAKIRELYVEKEKKMFDHHAAVVKEFEREYEEALAKAEEE